MNLVFPDQGLQYWMQQMLATGIDLHLFVNNVTITQSTLLSALTEATWTGYAVVPLAFGSWTFSVAGHTGIAIAGPQSFSNSSGSAQTAYGWYLTDSGSSMLLAGGQFDGAPVSIPDGGTQIVIPSVGDISKALTSP